MISAYKIVPDEIDEIKVCNLEICLFVYYICLYTVSVVMIIIINCEFVCM